MGSCWWGLESYEPIARGKAMGWLRRRVRGEYGLCELKVALRVCGRVRCGFMGSDGLFVGRVDCKNVLVCAGHRGVARGTVWPLVS